ncbi:MAG: hypothetical protein WCH43_03525, partial [Verrucomicrobiota bacterium]
AFYSLASGFYPGGVTGLTAKSPFSLVGYCIHNNRLERLGKALIWSGVTNSTPGGSGLTAETSPMVFSPITLTDRWNLDGTGATRDPDYQVLCNRVFRFEFCFLGKDGVYSGAFDPRKSVAAVVTIAVFNNQNPIPGLDLNDLAAQLPDGDDPGIADRWAGVIESMASARPGAIQDIRVYQHFFQLGALP